MVRPVQFGEERCIKLRKIEHCMNVAWRESDREMQEEKAIEEMREEQERETEERRRIEEYEKSEEGTRDEDERRVEQTEHELMLRPERKRATGGGSGYVRRVLPRTARLGTLAC